MKHLWKALVIFFFCIVLSLSARNVSRGSSNNFPDTDPVPVENLLHKDFNPEDRGTWFVGATPPHVKEDVHPIVFVQGLTGDAFEWWKNTEYYGENDMYKIAYSKGYRTAFVQLNEKKTGPLDQWDNGELLAKQLESISNYFDGEQVNIVAHSKGGVDSQVAVTYYKAHRFVDKIITLGSPHHGSYMADLFYSWYGNWLGNIVDRKGLGTYAMQTANMITFREDMDHHPDINKNRYYTASGTAWGPRLSLLWCGGVYLSQFGDNDGLINEASTHLPYGEHLFTANFDHDLMRKGSAIWDKIEPVLRKSELISMRNALVYPISNASASSQVGNYHSARPLENDQCISGGELFVNELQEKEIIVDRSEEVLFTVYSKSNDVQVVLCSPSGRLYTRNSDEYMLSTGTDVFQGTSIQSIHISKPEVGKWKMHLKSKQKDAYMLMTSLVGQHNYSLKFPSVVRQGIVPLHIQVPKRGDVNPSIRLKIIGPDRKLEDRQLAVGNSATSTFWSRGLQARLLNVSNLGARKVVDGGVRIGQKRGLYNVLFEIRQETKEGAVVRTVSRSIYVK